MITHMSTSPIDLLLFQNKLLCDNEDNEYPRSIGGGDERAYENRR